MSTPARRARLEIARSNIKGRDGWPKSFVPHFVRFRAANGRILAHTEDYANPTNAKRADRALRRAMAEVVVADLPALFRDHPEVVTAAHAYAERQRTSTPGATRGHGAFKSEEWEK